MSDYGKYGKYEIMVYNPKCYFIRVGNFKWSIVYHDDIKIWVTSCKIDELPILVQRRLIKMFGTIRVE